MRVGRTEQRHRRRPGGGGDVQGAGVARHHQRCGARQREQIGEAGRRRDAARRRPRFRRPRPPAPPRQVPTARTTAGRGRRAGTRRLRRIARAATACSARRRPGLISANGCSPPSAARTSASAGDSTSASGNSIVRVADPEAAQQCEVLVDHVHPLRSAGAIRRRPVSE